MPLNPLNAPLTTLTFTVASGGLVPDSLGNLVPGQTAIAVPVILTELSPNNLGQVQESLGTNQVGIPVKVRAATADGTFPTGIPRGILCEATLTYAGFPARLALMVARPNPHATGAGLVPLVGQSAMGLLSMG